MADNRYSDPRGSGSSDRERGRSDFNRGDENRERSRFSSSDYGDRSRGSDEDRGFFERAGEEIRSWFGGDEDDDRRGSSSYGRSSGGNRDHVQSWGEANRGDNSRSRSSSGGSDFSRNRGEWGSSDQSRGGYGRQQGSGGSERDFGSPTSQHFGYNDMSGMMGGFGNQRFASGQDDHYRSWRDKQIEQLDRDYQEYCRDCEQQFHQNFDSWRRNRQGNPSQSNEGGMSATGENSGSQSGSSRSSGSSGSGAAASTASGGSGSSSFIGGGSDPSAATAGGGGDPTPEPAGPEGGRSRSSRSRS